jgi:hypothetical protein
MEALRVEGSGYTPKVVLDPASNTFEISGRSLPEDVSAFYGPIIEWINNYAQNPNKKTVFEFKLTYYNTASSKLLLNIMSKLEDIVADDNEVLIKWYYPEDDEDLEEAGEEYADIVDVPFESIPY